MEIISKEKKYSEIVYDVIIEYGPEKYLFIARAIEVNGFKYLNIMRGISHVDCGKFLKRSEKNKIKKMIENDLKHAVQHTNS